MNAAGAGNPGDVVDTPAEAAAAKLEPLVVLEPLEAFLDGAGLGSGPLAMGAAHFVAEIGRGGADRLQRTHRAERRR